LVETVGVGQSETTVAEMVDFFLLLLAPGGGDELQGIKKGVIELADMIAVNKADGANADRARATVADYGAALRLLTPAESWWTPPVVPCSALTGEGVDEVWGLIERHHELAVANGKLDTRRRRQRVQWMWSTIDDTLMRAVRHHPAVADALPGLVEAVENDETTPTAAAEKALKAFGLDQAPE
ncbi:MAG TPA: methylmalonyl Co-A mutase-associated GTPase MeaB, partial [Acidimicrobiales bacterium]|nr:methylmalonyl Co-A mutase-associated GTPase MeaB [Acidimicrobiales bacterium]